MCCRGIGFGVLLALSSFAVWAGSPASSVDPFVGTDDMGHTYPGATVPFGLVQLSPQTDLVPYSSGEGYNPEAYRYCSGYQYGDGTIVGFAHTHFSGTGHSDLGDLLVMPTVGALQLDPGTAEEPEIGYRSRFSHERETAEPGAYRVTLDDYGIEVELTATERVGVHRYTFPESDAAHLILDLTANIYDYPGQDGVDVGAHGERQAADRIPPDHGLGALPGALLRHRIQQAGRVVRAAQRGGRDLPRLLAPLRPGPRLPRTGGPPDQVPLRLGDRRGRADRGQGRALERQHRRRGGQSRAEAPGWDFDALQGPGRRRAGPRVWPASRSMPDPVV